MDVGALVLYAAMGPPALAIGLAIHRQPRIDLLGNPDFGKLADPASYSRAAGRLFLAHGAFSLAFGLVFVFAPKHYTTDLLIALIAAQTAFVLAAPALHLRGTRARRER